MSEHATPPSSPCDTPVSSPRPERQCPAAPPRRLPRSRFPAASNQIIRNLEETADDDDDDDDVAQLYCYEKEDGSSANK